MAPKAKKPTPISKAPPQPKAPPQEPQKRAEPKTIGEKLQADYLASRPAEDLLSTKPWPSLTPSQKTAYTYSLLLSSEAYSSWPAAQQKEFLKACEGLKIPFPLPEPRPLGTDSKGRRIEEYGLEEYRIWRRERVEVLGLWEESRSFRRRAERLREREREREREKQAAAEGEDRSQRKIRLGKGEDEEWVLESELQGPERDSEITVQEIEVERKRRLRIAEIEGSKMPGFYEGDPEWDDVVPIPQNDGEKPLAAIAYTDEYSEAIAYLRAVMAAHEHSERALRLTAHIISLNPAHYTVWLYRTQILGTLSTLPPHSPTATIQSELTWLNDTALANQKNYQIWHHRQHLINQIYPTIASSRAEILDLARSEIEFMVGMFELDSKNYHVWSYREFLVYKLEIFPSQCATRASETGTEKGTETGTQRVSQEVTSAPDELLATAQFLEEDIRNNSAWAHRFFIVFSDPGHSTENCGATERDENVPQSIIKREVAFARWGVERAPQNMSPWNYLRGVLTKGGWGLDGAPSGNKQADKKEGEEIGEGEPGELEKWAAQFVYLPPKAKSEGAEGTEGASGGGGRGVAAKELVKSTHALEYLADLWAARGEVDRADEALRLLGEKYDRVRRAFWEWKREGLRAGG